MSDRGFTVLELLIACALMLAVTGAIAAMAVPVRDAFDRSLGAADLTGGSRVVLERLAAEVRDAGVGASVSPGRIRLGDVVPSVVPLGDVDSGPMVDAWRALRITRIPFVAPQGVLQDGAAVGDVMLRLDTAARCSDVGLGCGLRGGMLAILHDSTHAVEVTVHSVADGGVVQLMAPLTAAFPVGAVVAAVSVTTYGVRQDPDGSLRLVRVTQGAEQPMLQSVVDFEVTVHGADALHVRQVDFRLRVEASSAALRGPAARLFRRPGTASRATRWVPDVELRASVAIRNVAN